MVIRQYAKYGIEILKVSSQIRQLRVLQWVLYIAMYYQYKFSFTGKIPKDGWIIMRNCCGIFNTWSSDSRLYTKYGIKILKTSTRIRQFSVRQWALYIAMNYQCNWTDVNHSLKWRQNTCLSFTVYWHIIVIVIHNVRCSNTYRYYDKSHSSSNIPFSVWPLAHYITYIWTFPNKNTKCYVN